MEGNGGGFDYNMMNFVNHFRTHNIVLDTLLAIVISSLIPSLISYIKNLFTDSLDKKVRALLSKYFSNSEVEYHTFNITMKVIPKQISCFTNRESTIDDVQEIVIPLFHKFRSVISSNKYEDINVYFDTSELDDNNDVDNSKNYECNDIHNSQSNCLYLPTLNDEYVKYNDKIDISINVSQVAESTSKVTMVSISIRSCAPDANEYIMQFIDDAVKEYKNKQYNKYIRTDLFIYSSGSNNGHSKNEPINFSAVKVKHRKNIENVYIADSTRICSMLKHFVNKTGIYANPNTIHKFGLLLHGPPGTGKTSMIKAISKYLNRSIVYISLKDVQSDKALFEIFIKNMYIINGDQTSIPSSNIIYVFEDIDTHISLGKRTLNKTSINKLLRGKTDNIDNLNNIDIDELDNKAKFRSNSGEYTFTLGGFLNVLDGVVEPENRIIIMTTNCLEKLDPAIYRPGRVNMCVKFGYIEDAAIFRDICRYHHPADLPGNSESDMAALLASESLKKTLFDSAIVNKEYDQRVDRNKNKMFATNGIDIDNNEQINKIIEESLRNNKYSDNDSNRDYMDKICSDSESDHESDSDKKSTTKKLEKSNNKETDELIKQKKVEYLKRLTDLEYNKVVGLTASRLEEMCYESASIADLYQKYFSDTLPE